MNFKLVSEFEPKGDQPNAIKQLMDGLKKKSLFRHCLVLQVPVKLLQLQM
jgi:excinuclease UvrABC helicase subunit UvrB